MKELKPNRYEVVCGNVGNVHSGNNLTKAKKAFCEYVRQSESNCGRAGGEEVTLFDGGEPVREYFPDKWFPVREIVDLLKALKKDIGDEYRCSDDPDDTTPGMQVTISTDDGSNWSFQTGDTSFSGACYHHRHWACIYLYRKSNCASLAADAVEELKDLVAEEVA